MNAKKRGRKAKLTNQQTREYETFEKSVFHQFEAQKKILQIRKEEALRFVEQAAEGVKFQIHPSVLNTKLKDLCNEKNDGIQQNEKDLSETFSRAIIGPGSALSSATRHRLQPCTGSSYTLKTPGNIPMNKYIITPKVNPASPVGILRVPHQGEFAVSTTGSPLLVSTSARDDTANINIPLKNGKKMLILPNPNVNTDSISNNLDPLVRTQLETLQNTLQVILKNV